MPGTGGIESTEAAFTLKVFKVRRENQTHKQIMVRCQVGSKDGPMLDAEIDQVCNEGMGSPKPALSFLVCANG